MLAEPISNSTPGRARTELPHGLGIQTGARSKTTIGQLGRGKSVLAPMPPTRTSSRLRELRERGEAKVQADEEMG